MCVSMALGPACVGRLLFYLLFPHGQPPHELNNFLRSNKIQGISKNGKAKRTEIWMGMIVCAYGAIQPEIFPVVLKRVPVTLQPHVFKHFLPYPHHAFVTIVVLPHLFVLQLSFPRITKFVQKSPYRILWRRTY